MIPGTLPELTSRVFYHTTLLPGNVFRAHKTTWHPLAAGKDIKSGTIKVARLIDLAPTILTLLEQPVPPEMEGRASFHPQQS